MNYLAHLFLAGSDKELIYGNLLEDFMHGRIEHPRNNHLSPGIKNGIRLHRTIDSFTDSHPIVKETKGLFHEALGRYDSIAVDVLYDHFLIKNWSSFTLEEFDDFRPRIYSSLREFDTLMPPRLKAMVDSMIFHDWLKAYIFDDGLRRALTGLNKKIKEGPDMTLSIPIMHKYYEVIDGQFLAFFTELKEVCDQFIIQQKNIG